MDRRLTTLVLALGLLACHDFALAPAQQTRPVTLEPGAAFGDQEIALHFAGTVDVGGVQVSIGGKLATLPGGQDGNGVVRALVPRLDDTCLAAVPVLVSAPNAAFAAASLQYQGVGHPGNPRPVLSTNTKSVDFQPTSLAVLDDSGQSLLVASGYGEAALVIAPDGTGLGAPIYRKDFVLGLGTPGSGVVVDVTEHGQVEQFALLAHNQITPGGNETSAPGQDGGVVVEPLPPDLACYLPSALSQPPSLALLSGFDLQDPSGAPDAGSTFVYQGMLLAATPAMQAFKLSVDSAGLHQQPSDLTGWLRGAGSAAAAFDVQSLAIFRGGMVPAAWLVDANGEGVQQEFDLDADGDEWTVSATAGSTSGLAVAYLQASLGLDGRLILVGKPGSQRLPDCNCTPGEPCALDSGIGTGVCVIQDSGCTCEGEVSCDPTSCAGECAQSDQHGTCGLGDGGDCQCTADPSDSCSDGTTCQIGATCTLSPSAGVGTQGICGLDLDSNCACQTTSATSFDGGVGSPDASPAPGADQPDASAGDTSLAVKSELAIHGSPLVSLAADLEVSGTTIYAVDGASTWLFRFSVASDLTLTAQAPVPLPEPGTRVAMVSSSDSSLLGQSVPLVVGRSGKLYVGPSFSANRVRLGLSSVGSRLRPSCETPQAVVSASEIGAAAIVPTGEGPSAFLEGASGARFADTVTFDRDGGVPLAYFYSGGVPLSLDGGVGEAPAAGFLVSQTAAQIYALAADGGLPKKTEFHFSTRAGTQVRIADDRAVLVAGGPDGLRFIPIAAGSLPDESAATLDPSCPDVRQLASFPNGNPLVVALAHRAEQDDGTVQQTLCSASAASGSVTASAVVDFPVAALASAVTLEQEQAVLHLYTVGWEGAASGAQALVVRHALSTDPLSALAKLDFSGQAEQLLPTGGAPISTMAASPDGRRLLVAFAGANPGLLSIDPWPFLHAGSDADRAAALTTIALPAAPVGIGFTVDGALAVVALSDDTLAFVQ